MSKITVSVGAQTISPERISKLNSKQNKKNILTTKLGKKGFALIITGLILSKIFLKVETDSATLNAIFTALSLTWLALVVAGIIVIARGIRKNKKVSDTQLYQIIESVFPGMTVKVRTVSYRLSHDYYDRGLISVADSRERHTVEAVSDDESYTEFSCVIESDDGHKTVNYASYQKNVTVPIESTVRIVTTATTRFGREITGVKGKVSDEQHVDIEDIEFNKNFEVFAPVSTDVFKVITPALIDVLKGYRNTYGNFTMLISPGSVILVFQLSQSTMDAIVMQVNFNYITAQETADLTNQLYTTILTAARTVVTTILKGTN